ncbi:metallophosphoesterase family protein [Hydrogenovibrio kuenenii]|uniref:metallophosphoesterase family protein n=1 Tax=Hydrogenovibrio kuenenii TaxID=63658 RepID=UPI000463504C|nr:metallophosphatase domain-containing protein [Hydrogenovibrio kuenenii]
MRVVHISDTHGAHRFLDASISSYSADVIVHSGDVSRVGGVNECYAFLDWFSKLDYDHKILVPGNHDKFFETIYNLEDKAALKDIEDLGITLLMNKGVEIDGIYFWGSPFTPEFMDWSFQLYPEEQKTFWDQIPEKTDVLITHGPAYGLLDNNQLSKSHQPNLGCPFLRQRIDELQIGAHLFGHIHEGYGDRVVDKSYLALNSALMGNAGYLSRLPQMFEITHDGDKTMCKLQSVNAKA